MTSGSKRDSNGGKALACHAHESAFTTCQPTELAHYSKRTFDLMYNYPTLGYEEIEGIAARSDYDLGSHSRDQESLGLAAKVQANTDSTARLTYFDQDSKRHVVPS